MTCGALQGTGLCKRPWGDRSDRNELGRHNTLTGNYIPIAIDAGNSLADTYKYVFVGHHGPHTQDVATSNA